MKLRLNHLELTCKRAVYTIPFDDFTYFYGEMGAGKSTIARLIDYCFGGGLDMTPALQSEFVSATLDFKINDVHVRLERAVNANQVLASWGAAADAQQLIVPARAAGGEVLPNTGIEVLSDLLFYLAGVQPPKVRRSRLKDDSELQRLSFRNLFWYCYLDQDTIDSSFFHLDNGADFPRRLKSRTVLAYLLGYNQQRVAELETDLDEVRSERIAASEAAESLDASLDEAGVDSDLDIAAQLQALDVERKKLDASIQAHRSHLSAAKTHVTDRLTDRARQLVSEVQAVRDAISQVKTSIEQHRRHRNELLSLSTKFQRVTAARAVLNGVEFERCPRCTQPLPAREEAICVLCGQADTADAEPAVTATEADLSGRRAELEELITAQQEQIRVLGLRESRLIDEKQLIDATLGKEMQRYDSAYLSQVLETERRLAAVTEEARFLERLRILPARVEKFKQKADTLQAREVELRRQLREAREAAERDLTNVRLLGELFLDCLVRAKLPGFTTDDIVAMSGPDFVPSIMDRSSGEAAVSSFDTLGSGGKKTLFKCCFAVAVHRLAQRIGSVLPTLLIIDSPMKNISERENRLQFEGFHAMLYELAQSELADVQFIMIDKEFCAPSPEQKVKVRARHMTVDKDDDPPLIEYYRERPSTESLPATSSEPADSSTPDELKNQDRDV
ncbi:MAG: hypothetical protein GDA67_15455 [Nitrospira sp. CR1.3]|nr:hypothetical protein [Nitrospira sp. CR1.3]